MLEEFPIEVPSDSHLPRKIVVIGGGTGNSTVVGALTDPPFTGEGVTAIATTFDDGGGTGDLRKVYPELPAVGDMRQCFQAMSRLSPRLLEAMGSRFGSGDASERLKVEGQTLGNLNIAGIIKAELDRGGTFSSALDLVGELFQIKGKVVPPSNDIRTLVFDLPNGTRILGEHNAEESDLPSFRGAQISFMQGHSETCLNVASAIRPAVISPDADEAIRTADMVVLAPGDLYTSIAPNLAVQGMRDALLAAKCVVMISNLMNRARHTADFTTADYAREYTRFIGAQVIKYIIYNTAKLDKEALAQQKAKGSSPVRPAVDELEKQGYTVTGYDLLSRKRVSVDPNDALGASRSEIRHDPAKIAGAIFATYLFANAKGQ